MRINDTNRAMVLACLYNNSRYQGLGRFNYTSKQMTVEEAEKILSEQRYFDYLNGRVMKVDLSDDFVDFNLYDRDNGNGAGMRACSGLEI